MGRQKVSVACDNCRRRKVKCDSREPTCGPCKARGETRCIYSRDHNWRKTNRAILPRYSLPPDSVAPAAALIDTASPPTIAENETLIHQREVTSPDQSFNTTAISSNKSGSMPCSIQASTSANQSNTPRARIPQTTPKNTDAMTGVTRDSTTSLEFFGSSSAVSFMRQINSAIDARLERCQPSNPDPDKNCRQSGNANLVASQQEDSIDPLTLTLPPRNFADNLLQDYHDLVWVILPIHDWTVFQAAYNSIWLGSATHIPERPLYCMINMAFALGSQFSHAVQPMHRKKMGQTFWEKARTLFDPRLYEGASLEGVQCLLLMGLFLQSTCESHQCWMAVGAAVRMAQSLGLHLLSATGRQNEGVREVEISRRVWHGCVFMDRVLSITFGRPSMIADWLCDAVPLPLMIDDEYLDQDVEPAAIRPDGKTTAVAFFVKTLELYSIVNDSLRELYMRPADEACKDHQQLLSVLKLDNRLVQWAHSIPEQLCYISSKPQEDSAILRQSIVLRASTISSRPHGYSSPGARRILLTTNQTKSSSLASPSRRKLISKLRESVLQMTGPVPAWWFAVLFVYTAAIVLLAERFRSNLNPSSESEPWLANIAWDRAIQLLKAYSKVGESAERCVAALEILSTKIQGQSGSAQHGKDTAQSSSIDNILNPDSITCQSDEGLLSGFDDLTASLNMEGMDFNIDDNLLWLNSSVADIMF